MPENILINKQAVGGPSTYIVAELSANHNGSLENALEGVRAAKAAGADAIKIQTYTADTITIDCDNEYFQINHGSIWDGTTLHKLYQEAGTPFEWHEQIFKTAEEIGITCFSSPFDETAVDLLERLGCPAYKIASPEILDINLIRKVAKTGKPVIISSGIASLKDIELAVSTCREVNNNQIIVLKCTAEYPAPVEKANLATISHISKAFDVLSGLSDHTLGITVPVLSVAMGASLIEKHFIVDRSIGGPDSSFSLDFDQFKEMVKAVREAEKAIGKVFYKEDIPDTAERGMVGRSLFVVEDVKEGEKFTDSNVRSIRPGYGLHPKFFPDVIGKQATMNLKRGIPLRPSHILNFGGK